MSLDKRFDHIRTEGIKYSGSKKKIIPHIARLVSRLNGVKDVFDGFAGTTRVSQAFAQMGYNTTAGDISVWSEVFATCYLKALKADSFYAEIIDHLNGLRGIDGWFSEHYGSDDTLRKRPFRLKNTRKLDAVREEIERLNLAWEDKCVVLTSLILALDKVDNTLGHFSAYLSGWATRSFNDLTLKLPQRFALTSNNAVVRGDVFDTIKNRTFDLTYFDPPYGSNNEKMPSSRVRYASYYHIWKTVILNDRPSLFGKANRREDTRDSVSASVFEEFRKDNDNRFVAMKALDTLIRNTQSRYILLSYSSGGRATKKELVDILASSGKLLEAIEIEHRQNIQAKMRWTEEWVNSDGKHKEYLFLLEK